MGYYPIKYRYYQDDAIRSLWDYFERFEYQAGNPLVVMPTGTGKSLVIGGFLHEACQRFPFTRAMMLTHSSKLVKQNFATACKIWPTAPIGVYCDKLKRKELGAPITFGTINSAVNKAAAFGFIDFLLIDEAHMVSPSEKTMYQKLIAVLKRTNPFLKVIGFTATPFRMKQGMLIEPGSIFTDICYDISDFESFNRLLAEGFMTRLVVPANLSTQIDISSVRVTGGEFNQKDLARVSDQERITRAAIEETLAHGADRKHWVVFATDIAHCEHVAAILNEMGVSAVAVHSGNKEFPLDEDEADKRLELFEAGKVTALVNNNQLTTGYDFAGIDLILVLRAVMSPGLWVQMLGRGTRCVFAPGFDLDTVIGRLSAIMAGPKQSCLVMDFAGNRRRLGPINDPIKPNPKKKGPPGDAPFKICPNIKCQCYQHASARFCSECGTLFPIRTKLEEEFATDDIIRGMGKPEEPEEMILHRLKVDSVDYALHRPRDGRPPSLLVTYGCGFRKFKEYVCLQHGGYPQQKARDWWMTRNPGTLTIPDTVAEAYSLVGTLFKPSEVEIHEKPARNAEKHGRFEVNRCFFPCGPNNEKLIDGPNGQFQ